MTPDRERLKTAIENRAVELRLKLNKVAQRADMSPANFLRIRTGEVALTPFAVAAIEQALDWEPGSIQRILDGLEPTPRQRERELPPAPPGVDPEQWRAWDPLDREMVLAAVRVANARTQQQSPHSAA